MIVTIFLYQIWLTESCEAQRAEAKKYLVKKSFLTIAILRARLQVKECPLSDERHGIPKPVGIEIQ